MSLFDGLPDIFVQTFGQAVTVRPVDGFATEITAIFKVPSNIDGIETGAVVHETHICAREEDVADMVYGSTVIVGGVTYTSGTPRPDERGMTYIPLIK